MEQVSFKDLGVFVAILILGIQPLLALANFFISLFRKPEPQKREVRFETEFATKDDLRSVNIKVEAVDAKVDDLKDEIVRNGETRRLAIEGKVEEARKETREATGDLHEKVNGVVKQVGGLDAKCDQMNQQLFGMDAKIMRLLERGGRAT